MFVIILASTIFVIGYALIAFAEYLHINKTAVALATGSVLWLIVALLGNKEALDGLPEASSDVFAIVVFLLIAMSIVEILVHYHFFDVVRGKLFSLHLDEKKQFLLIVFISFFLSAMLDNLTTTIVMIQIARRFFKDKNLLLAGVGIVIAANAGGAFSPIGDVTTIMLWFANKYTAMEILSRGFLPAITLQVVSMGLLYLKLETGTASFPEETVEKLSLSEKTILGLALFAFTLPLVVSYVNVPPYIGLMFGLSILWLAIDTFKRTAPNETHLSADIETIIKKVDISVLKFFIGILLAVSALHSLGALELLANWMYGATPTTMSIVIGHTGLGLLSALVDNVPLTAIAIKMLAISNPSYWVLLALTVGTGGSILVIGSAAGVMSLSMLEKQGMTFWKYAELAAVPAMVGYFAGIGVWYVQYLLIG